MIRSYNRPTTCMSPFLIVMRKHILQNQDTDRTVRHQVSTNYNRPSQPSEGFLVIIVIQFLAHPKLYTVAISTFGIAGNLFSQKHKKYFTKDEFFCNRQIVLYQEGKHHACYRLHYSMYAKILRKKP